VGHRQDLTRAFLLDTHVWLWTVEGAARHIGRRTIRLIERWAARDALRISPLSVFEIASLCVSGRLQLSRPPEQWTALALASTRARLASLPLEAALEAGSIGTAIVGDPIDRLLIATARHADATFVTADRRILDYAASRRDLRTHDARR
jgi:PIN domain nuclease of toxin-antitoxin system